jgi:hypothetical protein
MERTMTVAIWMLVSLTALGLLGAGITSLIKALLDNERRLTALEAKEQEREKYMTDARGRQRKHHAYNTIEAIEDAMALLISAEMDADALRARQETALGILQTLRNGRSK